MSHINEKATKDRIEKLENDILKARKELTGLKRDLPKEDVSEYTFMDLDGARVDLSDLFGNHDELIVIHNMGKRCAYCTLWADGFNGILGHLENRAAFVVISPDDPATQKSFAESRGWKFRILSGKESKFTKDMGFEHDDGKYMPGFSTFHKDSDGRIFRTAYDYFGPGDPYCGIWHMFELLPNGVNGWQPKFQY
ncbi:MAG: DUF899 family protein [candidate division Zixibacteria bacterium]